MQGFPNIGIAYPIDADDVRRIDLITTCGLSRPIVDVAEHSLYEAPIVCREEGDEGILLWIRTGTSDSWDDGVRKIVSGLLE